MSDDALAVERMYAALEGELRRRQEILHAAGGFANIDEYVKARSRGQVDTDRFPHLPALLIIVDEFSELLAERPEFAELFVQIGRLGRSLHVHLRSHHSVLMPANFVAWNPTCPIALP